MNLMKNMVLGSFMFSLSFTTFAGDRVGNGGGTFTCWNGNEATKSISYDLWIAANEHKLVIERHNQFSVQEQYRKAVKRLGQYSEIFDQQLMQIADDVYLKINQDLNNDRVLAIQNDFTPDEMPGHQFCGNGQLPKFQTVILYKDGSNSLNADIQNLNAILKLDTIKTYALLVNNLESNTDFAALILHEAIYKWMRMHEKLLNQESYYNNRPWNEVSANNVFKYVGLAFSAQSESELMAELHKDKMINKAFKGQVFNFNKDTFKLFIKAKTVDEIERVLARTTKHNGIIYQVDVNKITIYNYYIDESYNNPGHLGPAGIGITLDLLGYSVFNLSPLHVKYCLDRRINDPQNKYLVEISLLDNNYKQTGGYSYEYNLKRITRKITKLREISSDQVIKSTQREIINLINN